MKSATILPTPYLHLAKDDTYHMCLAHLMGKDAEYTRFFEEKANDPNCYVVMDNGVIEGDCRPIEEIIKKALKYKVDEIILPDVFRNQKETLEKSYSALRYVQDAAPDLKMMAVPQGETLDEWLECAHAMIDWDIHCLGIPKVLCSFGGRDGRLNALMFLGNKVRGLDVHLLGCWNSPLEVMMVERAVKNKTIRPVRGVDSVIAYVFAREGLSLTQADRPAGHVDFSAKDADMDLLVKNIEIWKDACDFTDEDKILRLFR